MCKLLLLVIIFVKAFVWYGFKYLFTFITFIQRLNLLDIHLKKSKKQVLYKIFIYEIVLPNFRDKQ